MSNTSFNSLNADKVLHTIFEKEVQEINHILRKEGEIENLNDTVKFLLNEGFIYIGDDKGENSLHTTIAGRNYLNNIKANTNTYTQKGGDKSFVQHLEESTNLITIFGILNAVIIFAKQSVSIDKDAAQIISISMYALSLMVIAEIFLKTWKLHKDTFKFHLFYLILFSTTVGIGKLFFKEYTPLFIVFIYFGLFFGLIFIIFNVLLKAFARFINRRNSKWIKNHVQILFFILFIVTLSFVLIIFKVALPYIKDITSFIEAIAK